MRKNKTSIMKDTDKKRQDGEINMSIADMIDLVCLLSKEDMTTALDQKWCIPIHTTGDHYNDTWELSWKKLNRKETKYNG